MSIKTGRSVSEIEIENPRTIRTINRLFAQADLSPHIILDKGIIRARRGSSEAYGIDRLSDGERAALLLVGAILVRPKSSVIAIDEPEKHLNPQISANLIAATIRSRPDLSYFIASHDLQLIEHLKPSKVVYVSDSEVLSSSASLEHRSYEVKILTGNDDVPEDIKARVLGTRKPLLFVEGENHSDDRNFYKYVYPNRTVVPRGGWEGVVAAVRAITSSSVFHWVDAAGLLDRDGRNSAEIEGLATDNVMTLPGPTIENLFFHPVVVRQMALLHHAVYGGVPADVRFEAAALKSIEVMKNESKLIVSRKVVWKANRILSERKISVKNVMEGQGLIRGLDLAEIKNEAQIELNASLEPSRPFRACFKQPIKNTSVPNKVVQEIGYKSFSEYRLAVLNSMETQSAYGKRIIRAMRHILPNL